MDQCHAPIAECDRFRSGPLSSTPFIQPAAQLFVLPAKLIFRLHEMDLILSIHLGKLFRDGPLESNQRIVFNVTFRTWIRVDIAHGRGKAHGLSALAAYENETPVPPGCPASRAISRLRYSQDGASSQRHPVAVTLWRRASHSSRPQGASVQRAVGISMKVSVPRSEKHVIDVNCSFRSAATISACPG